MKARTFIGEACCHMMSCVYRIIIDWLFQQWCNRMARLVIVYNICYCFFGINDIVSGSIRYYRHTKTTAKRWFERGRRLTFLCCVYAVAYASCAIHLVKSNVVHMAKSFAQSGGDVSCNLLIDSLSTLLPRSCPLPSGDGRMDHPDACSRCHGIPWWHNGRKAGKRDRARPPPFRSSCHRKHNNNVNDVTTEKITTKKPLMLPPRRLARY